MCVWNGGGGWRGEMQVADKVALRVRGCRFEGVGCWVGVGTRAAERERRGGGRAGRHWGGRGREHWGEGGVEKQRGR